MNPSAIAAVFRRVIAEQSQIKEIGRPREKFEGGEVAFVERAGVRPNPASAMFFQKTNDLRLMPCGMAELDRETEIAR